MSDRDLFVPVDGSILIWLGYRVNSESVHGGDVHASPGEVPASLGLG